MGYLSSRTARREEGSLAPTATSAHRDLAPDSRPLKLVKLRLALCLFAMAVLPLAVAAPLGYSVLDSQQYAEHLRAERDSISLASALGMRLHLVEEAVTRAATSPPLMGVMAVPQKAATGTARATLLALGSSTDDAIGDVLVVDLDGSVRAFIHDGKIASGRPKPAANDDVLVATLALDGPDAYASYVHLDAAGNPSITIAAPVPAADGNDAAGIVRVEVSLLHVLTSVAARLTGGDHLSQLLNQSGTVLAQARDPDAGPIDGTIATAAVPGFPEWRIQLTTRHQPLHVPTGLLGGLTIVVLAVGVLIVWMARQVIRPAEELEGSRRRLRDMYEGARLDALHDAFTGLGNHRAYQEEFDRQLDAAKRYSTPLALVLIDLDDFKTVNDTSGHAAGDDLLAEMGRLASVNLRTADRAFRVGGDEFAVLMPHTDAEAGRVVARRLLAAALETRPGSDVPTSFSFSVGISAFPAMAVDRRQLSAQADSALYWAKAHGRTMVQIFDPARHRNLAVDQSDGDLSSSVADIAARRALRAVYQPIVELRSGRVIG